MQRAIGALAAVLLTLACGQALVAAQPAPEPPTFATSGDVSFDEWRDDFARRAVARGRDPAVLGRLLSGIAPDSRIVDLDRRQPEFVSPVWDYVTNRVTENRIVGGRNLKAAIGSTLDAVEARYGVPGGIILGVWGLESNYGEAALNYNAAAALATLAHEGRRRAQFETYLLALIELVERGADPSQLRSSWAGALGQPQFMPDVYLTTAVDWDGDGRRDIWTNRGDVAASIAHYLSDRGWRRGDPVFEEVRLPQGFDYALADGALRTVADWTERGVAPIGGGGWPESHRALQAQLFLPAGAQGPALLLHHNFSVIRRYNNSDRYALVVALLARAFDGREGLVQSWPRQLGSLNRDQILELQTLLNVLGYEAGEPDGLFGSRTRAAVRGFQAAETLTADGFPTAALLDQVRAKAGVAPATVREPRGLERGGVRELQRLLNRLGHSAGTADGVIGERTRDAIRAFERARGMEVRGRATDVVLEAARAAAG